jgi:3-oxoacyl-[acyl-carrier protein] reductase
MRFQGKNIAVIGGSSGISHDLVQLLNREGTNVYAASRSSSDSSRASVRYQLPDMVENIDLFSPLQEELHRRVYSVGSISLKPFSRTKDKGIARLSYAKPGVSLKRLS